MHIKHGCTYIFNCACVRLCMGTNIYIYLCPYKHYGNTFVSMYIRMWTFNKFPDIFLYRHLKLSSTLESSVSYC